MQLTGLEGQIFIGLGAGMGHKMTLQSVTGCGESYPSRDGMWPLSRIFKTRGIHTKLENFVIKILGARLLYTISSVQTCVRFNPWWIDPIGSLFSRTIKKFTVTGNEHSRNSIFDDGTLWAPTQNYKMRVKKSNVKSKRCSLHCGARQKSLERLDLK